MRRLFLFVIFWGISISYAQNFSNKNVTVVARNKPLSYVLEQISQQTGLYFAYPSDKIDVNQHITLVARNQPLDLILELLAERLNVEYKIIARQIVLKPREIKPLKQNEPLFFRISGYLTDSVSGEVLIGASIFANNKLIAITNEYGYYSARIPAGKYLLKAKYLGYGTKAVAITLHADTTVNFELSPKYQMLDVVLVTPEDNTQFMEKNSLEYTSYTNVQIMRNPGLGGSFDALKSLQALPGFNFYGDGSLIFHVRGGLRSQNLILIDDAPVLDAIVFVRNMIIFTSLCESEL
jgi:hypothetical protein